MAISKDTAEHYRQNSSVQLGFAQKLLQKHDFSRCTSLLDIGCGDGKITEAISRLAPHAEVTGVDLSPAMIELARTNHEGITFQVADASFLELGTTFDCATCLSCLHWVRRPAEAVTRMALHLNPGATLLILTFPKESLYYRIFAEGLLDPRFKDFSELSANQSLLTIQEHREALSRAGLSIEFFDIENDIIHYESAQGFMDYVKGWLPCWVSLPEELLDPYLYHVAELAESKWGNDKGISIPFTKISIKAKKPLE